MNDSTTFAAKFLEDLVAFFGLNVSVETHLDRDVLELKVPSSHLNGFLIGQRGENLRSIQYLVNHALRVRGHEDIHASVDVADYKAQRTERLTEEAQSWIDEVKSSGKPYDVRPMNAYERRVVHQLASDTDGIKSESVGEGRERHIVISPDSSE